MHSRSKLGRPTGRGRRTTRFSSVGRLERRWTRGKRSASASPPGSPTMELEPVCHWLSSCDRCFRASAGSLPLSAYYHFFFSFYLRYPLFSLCVLCSESLRVAQTLQPEFPAARLSCTPGPANGRCSVRRTVVRSRPRLPAAAGGAAATGVEAHGRATVSAPPHGGVP